MAYGIYDNRDNQKVAEFRYLIDAAKFFLISCGQFYIKPLDQDSKEYMQERSEEILQTAFQAIRKPTVWAQ